MDDKYFYNILWIGYGRAILDARVRAENELHNSNGVVCTASTELQPQHLITKVLETQGITSYMRGFYIVHYSGIRFSPLQRKSYDGFVLYLRNGYSSQRLILSSLGADFDENVGDLLSEDIDSRTAEDDFLEFLGYMEGSAFMKRHCSMPIGCDGADYESLMPPHSIRLPYENT